MKIALLGASGPTGQSLLAQAVEQDHEVIAIVRRPDSVPSRSGVTVATADVTAPAQLAKTFTGVDVVMSCLGTQYSWRPITLYSDSARAIIRAMRTAHTRRAVLVSSGMTHPITSGGITSQRPIYAFLRHGPGRTLYADMRRMEDILTGADDLDWTIMRPTRLVDATNSDDQLQRTSALPRGRATTTRRDLAAAMLDEIHSPQIHKGVFVTSR